jgi:hypothetical protein
MDENSIKNWAKRNYNSLRLNGLSQEDISYKFETEYGLNYEKVRKILDPYEDEWYNKPKKDREIATLRHQKLTLLSYIDKVLETIDSLENHEGIYKENEFRMLCKVILEQALGCIDLEVSFWEVLTPLGRWDWLPGALDMALKHPGVNNTSNTNPV